MASPWKYSWMCKGCWWDVFSFYLILPVLLLLHRKAREAGTRNLKLECWSRLHYSVYEAELSDIQAQLWCYSPNAHTVEMQVRTSLRTASPCTQWPLFSVSSITSIREVNMWVEEELKPLFFWGYIVISFSLLLSSVTDQVLWLLMSSETVSTLHYSYQMA